jgi:CheY-like chemotaxis protein
VSETIFAIDDDADFLETIRLILEPAGFQVDGVTTLEAAFTKLDSRTYPVAIVDLMLKPKDINNMDGLKVLDKLRELREGTRAIVLSVQTETQVAAETILDHGAADYLDKTTVGRDLKQLTAKVTHQLKEARINRYGRANSAVAFVESLSHTWIADLLRVTRPGGGFSELRQFLAEFCDPLAPLLCPHAPEPCLGIDNSKQTGYGTFWSKGVGSGVQLVIANAESGAGEPDPSKGPDLRVYTRSSLTGRVIPLPHAKREEFLPSVWG